MLPDISVLMPVYHRDTFPQFFNAFQSIVQQSYPPNEFVIVLDGPVDSGISDYLAKENFQVPVRVVRLKENKGIGFALQQGLLHCKSDWIARMDADDISSLNRLEIMAESIADDPALAVIGSWIADAEVPDQPPYFIRKVPLTQQHIKYFSKFRSPFNHPAVVVNKAAVLAAGGYRNFFKYEDWDLWLRLLEGKARFANIPVVLVATRQNYGRRKGMENLRNDIHALYQFYRAGHHSLMVCCLNILYRLISRSVPFFTSTFYKYLLRKKITRYPDEFIFPTI